MYWKIGWKRMELHKKKRILITIDWFLPGYKAGGPIQSCANLITHLKDKYEFWVITRDTDYCSDVPYKGISSDTWTKLEDNVHVFYFSRKGLSPLRLFKLVKDTSADVLFINGIYSLYFSLLPLLFAKAINKSKIILSGRGMFAPGSINVKSGKKQAFFSIAKKLQLYKGVIFHATNLAEQKDIKAILGEKNAILIAPNLPKQVNDVKSTRRIKEPGKLKLVSVARISPEKNTLFALETLSKYRGEGEITFDIFGPVYNEQYWEKCKEIYKLMPRNVKVNYYGSLDNNMVAETLQNYHALFMPTKGENFGHIILESLTSGCPVLISDKTPWRGLKTAGVGYDLSLTEVGDFLEAIDDLVQLNAQHFNHMSVKAFEYAKKYINDPAAVEANYKLFTRDYLSTDSLLKSKYI
ncbi:glycosyltransferase family 4 protein [Pontibacter fetidus]|uniref:Glycosyltransferase family 4 protein n=1 Tax=Pontibacter fetidus TaxID=2700082 RepID=A0A6B2H1M4_9BACT|nr:glycosyltransferase family 4 protein [Pontibacter fetidus]NDK54516.1 glycosyltransferase family 4 protein [Pontibacter fetidus]